MADLSGEPPCHCNHTPPGLRTHGGGRFQEKACFFAHPLLLDGMGQTSAINALGRARRFSELGNGSFRAQVAPPSSPGSSLSDGSRDGSRVISCSITWPLPCPLRSGIERLLPSCSCSKRDSSADTPNSICPSMGCVALPSILSKHSRMAATRVISCLAYLVKRTSSLTISGACNANAALMSAFALLRGLPFLRPALAGRGCPLTNGIYVMTACDFNEQSRAKRML